jgi:hypothetical protein
MKPKVFIGSSSEGKSFAEAIHAYLFSEAECTVWTEGVFGPSDYTLQSLLRQAHTSEFGIFVFSPDDLATMRGELLSVPRDNVVFELGLFSGALEPERCFFAIPDNVKIHLPSDLMGITAGKYENGRRDGNTRAAVAVFCSAVLEKIKALTLSLRFVDPQPNAKLETYKTGGKQTFICECNRLPPPDVFILTQRGNLWWPQPSRIERSISGKYSFNCWFGATGLHIVHVLRANVLGSKLIEYYLDVTRRLEEQRGKLRKMKIYRG